nr:hypothetical protein GCM10020092_078280 [Actinoplanes digitatis]
MSQPGNGWSAPYGSARIGQPSRVPATLAGAIVSTPHSQRLGGGRHQHVVACLLERPAERYEREDMPEHRRRHDEYAHQLTVERVAPWHSRPESTPAETCGESAERRTSAMSTMD